MFVNVLQICDGRAFKHKRLFEDTNFPNHQPGLICGARIPAYCKCAVSGHFSSRQSHL